MDDDRKRQGAKRIAACNSEFQKWHRFGLGHVMFAHANILSPKKNKKQKQKKLSLKFYILHKSGSKHYRRQEGGRGLGVKKPETKPPGLGYRRVRQKPEAELPGLGYRCVVKNHCGG